MGAGPVFDFRHGLAPNQLIAQGWYHYYPNVIGGVGLEFSSRNPSRLQAYNRNRYDMTTTWIPFRATDRLTEVSLLADLTTSHGYIDTAEIEPGAHAVSDFGTEWGLALRIGYGRRLSNTYAWWVAGSPGLAYRPWGGSSGVNFGFNGEAGMTYSLLSIWYDAKTLTRAWDVFIRVPFRIESGSPAVSAGGVHRLANWSLGIQAGPTVLF